MPLSAMRDVDTTLRLGSSAGDLTSTETLAVKAIQGTPFHGLSMVVNCPSTVTGTNPTLDVKVQESADGSSYQDLVVFKQITAKGTYIRRFYTPKKYVRAVLTVGGTSPNFGQVDVYLTVNDLDHGN